MLPRVAEWLIDRYGSEMGAATVVLPAARAGRRLEEILAERLHGQAWSPSNILTTGALPERLYEAAPDGPDDLTALLARLRSLRLADAEVLQTVVPMPPEPGDIAGWWTLAEQFAKLSQDLAASRLTPQDVSRLAADRGIDLGLSAPRWDALAQLESAYHELSPGPDRQRQRLDAIRENCCRHDGDLILVGVIDPTRQLLAMLDAIADQVQVLVQAPAEHAEGFDVWGGVKPSYWRDQLFEVQQLHIVDDPAAEDRAVLQSLAKLPGGEPVDAVTIGLGDEQRAGALGRAMDTAGLPSRFAGGRPASVSRPARLLQAAADWLNRRDFATLATLARHPDVAVMIGKAMSNGSWLTSLDMHTNQYLQADLTQALRGQGDAAKQVERLMKAIDDWLSVASDGRTQPLPNWSEPIATLVGQCFGHASLDRRADHFLIESLEALAAVLREQAALDPQAEITPRVDLAEAMSLTARRLAQAILPEPADTPSIEMVGLLELPLDDAAYLVLTGMNEGHVPDTTQGDAFLPDSLRSALNMPDNAYRLARDHVLVTAAIRGRESAVLTCCRRGPEGDPLLPSRLLLACDDETLTNRLAEFFSESHEQHADPGILQPGPTNQFIIPRPTLPAPTIDHLSVTQFKAYLACPYRFYLGYVLKLDGIDDRAVEMDALAFGSLAHDLLEQFALSDVADSHDPRDILHVLSPMLDDKVKRRFGRHPRAAVQVQAERLRERLERFAQAQANETRRGWQICRDLIEQKFEVQVDVDGKPFTITGRIDRIDRHPEFGHRLLDYKTTEAGPTPNQTHRRAGQWIDLQLPLYHTLVADIGITDAALGYFNLPKSGDKQGVVLANWDPARLDEAKQTRDAVIRGVRGQKFWPPSDDLPMWNDPFVRIAADKAVDRQTLIGGEA